MKWLSGVFVVVLVAAFAMLSGCTKAEEPMEESAPQEMSQPAEPAAPMPEEPAPAPDAPVEEPAPANP